MHGSDAPCPQATLGRLAMTVCPFRVAGQVSSSDRQGFDRRWYAPNLHMVFTPFNDDEVLAAAQYICEQPNIDPGAVQITSGRHCYEGFVYNENTLFIIDVTGLRDFGWNADDGYYIGVGYGNWDMYRMFNNAWGRTLPAGSCYSVGLGGHITGGGYVMLSRFHGLTIDHLTGVDIVAFPSGLPKLVHCSLTENPDLFWAIRGGGGGNFGIITKYYFKDPPRAPEFMYTSAITINWDGLVPKISSTS